MSIEGQGKSAPWAKALAVFAFLVLMPLAIWFMISFPRSGPSPEHGPAAPRTAATAEY